MFLNLILLCKRSPTSSNPLVDQARMDGSNMLWSLPRNLPPLVHPPFIEKGLKLGVGGRYLSECVAQQRGYMIHDNNGTLEIRIPFGAEGGFIKVSQRSYDFSVVEMYHFFLYPNLKNFKCNVSIIHCLSPPLGQSHVIDGHYSQSYFVDVFLVHEWEDTAWSLTQQRTFRKLYIYHQPRPVMLINSEKHKPNHLHILL